MKVYLAGAWSRRAEIAEVARRLSLAGVEITSRWLVAETGMTYSVMESGYKEKFLRECAYHDLADVDAADVVVRFTDDFEIEQQVINGRIYVPVEYTSGARHTEFGYGKKGGKSLITVGGKQNVFDRLDGITHIANAEALIDYLTQG